MDALAHALTSGGDVRSWGTREAQPHVRAAGKQAHRSARLAFHGGRVRKERLERLLRCVCG